MSAEANFRGIQYSQAKDNKSRNMYVREARPGEEVTEGLDATQRKKMAAKYSTELETQAREFIEEVTGEPVPGGREEFAGRLKSGVLLCELANELMEGAVRKINRGKIAFMQMENISNFLKAIEKMGVSTHSSFQPPDLFELKNVGQVVTTIMALRDVASGRCAPAAKKKEPTAVGRLRARSKGERQMREQAEAVEAAAYREAELHEKALEETKRQMADLKMGQGSASQTMGGIKHDMTNGIGSGGAASSRNQFVRDAKPGEEVVEGLDATHRRKMAEKYSLELEDEAREFIQQVTDAPVGEGMEDFAESLKDGITLCELANTLCPGSVAKISESKIAFMQMQNIASFLTACQAMGVRSSDTFQPPDLFETKNISQVITCILALRATCVADDDDEEAIEM